MRLIGAVLMEIDEAWSTGRRYLNMEEYWRRRLSRTGLHIHLRNVALDLSQSALVTLSHLLILELVGQAVRLREAPCRNQELSCQGDDCSPVPNLLDLTSVKPRQGALLTPDNNDSNVPSRTTHLKSLRSQPSLETSIIPTVTAISGPD